MIAASYERVSRAERGSSTTRNQAEAQRPAQVVDYVPHCRVCSGARCISEEVNENGPYTHVVFGATPNRT